MNISRVKPAGKLLSLILVVSFISNCTGGASTQDPPLGIVIENPYSLYLEQYKGQIHVHSGESHDGTGSPFQVELAYKNAGYDFICLTDHDEITGDPNVPGILHIQSAEDGDSGARHILALGAAGIYGGDSDDPNDSQPRIDYLTLNQDALAVIAHPASDNYGFTNVNEFMSLINYTGLQIYNAGSGTIDNIEDRSVYWDPLLGSGILKWGFAGDDCHNIYEMNPVSFEVKQKEIGNFNRGWIEVNSASSHVSQDDLFENIKNGNFYSLTRVRAWFSTESFDGYDPGEPSRSSWYINIFNNNSSSTLVKRIFLIHKTSDRTDAGTDADVKLYIDDVSFDVYDIPDWDERETGDTDMYPININDTKVDTRLIRKVELEVTGNGADDAWLPDSIWLIGETVENEYILIAGENAWPENAWFSTEADEGQPKYELLVQPLADRNSILRSLTLIHKTSSSEDTGTDGDFILHIKNDSFELRNLSYDERESSVTDTYVVNMTGLNINAADLQQGDISLEIFGSGSEDAWLPDAVWAIGELENNSFVLLAGTPNWPGDPPKFNVEAKQATAQIRVYIRSFDGPYAIIRFIGGKDDLSGQLLYEQSVNSPKQNVSYLCTGSEGYVRVEVEDYYGNVTYSQPLLIHK